MRALRLPETGSEPPTVLLLGAHADDVEIGCGATVLELARLRPDARVHWVVLSASGERHGEAARSAAGFLAGFREPCVELGDFRDGFFPYDGGRVKEFFEGLKARVRPDLILTHHRHDLHQDHRLVCELTWNTFRDHVVLEYEIPKYEGDLGTPNVLVPIPRDAAARKVALLMEHFASQRGRYWFTEETFLALLRLRGVEARSPTGYAEGFHGRKLALDLSKG